MGCDGGTIPRRDEMVKLKKKAEKADKDMELMARWRHCAISGEELKQPIVACELGRLYNKETVLMALLDKSSMPVIGRHIRSLKDITVLQLTPNPSYKPSGKAGAFDTQSAEYKCPVTGLDMSGRYRFVFVRGCGCVVSEKAMKEVPTKACHKCGRPFSAEEVVPLNSGEEEEKALREAMEERRKQAKLAKRKRKAVMSDPSTSTTTSSATSATSSESDKESPPPEKKHKPPPHPATTATAAAATKPPPHPATTATAAAATKPPPHPATTTTAAAATTPQPPPPQSPKSSYHGKTNASQPSRPSSSSTPISVAGKGTPLPNTASHATGISENGKLRRVPSSSSDATEVGRAEVAERAQSRKAYKSLFSSNAGERPKEITSHWVTFFPYH